MNTTVRPFCSPDCAERHGWLEDSDGNITGRCDCRMTGPSPEQARTAALNETAAAHPRQMEAATLVIRDTALRLAFLSGNDTRPAMLHAQISGAVVGAAFRRAESLGYIAATDRMVQSTDPDTRHRITIWQSLICKSVAS